MEFLDPLARKKRERQLFIGYALLSVLVLLSTYILLSAVQGYELFSRSGSVVQNGLVFVDAQPTAAEIYLNGQDQNKKTDKKLALKDGIYDLTLKASGYRDWQKKLTISGGKVKFVTYPQLYPAVLSPKIMNTYSSSVGFASLSLDKHWLVIQPAANVPV